jgi:type I restriction enzyme M protein
MKLTDVLGFTKLPSSLNLFSAKTIMAVEASFLEKNGKHYLKCPVRGKEIQVKPEEIVRQMWIQRLVLDYGYCIAGW